MAAEVTDLTVADVAPSTHRDTWSRTDAMAVVAAREALAEARLDPRRDEVHVAIGGTTGGMFETEQMLAEMHRDPSRREPRARMLSHPLSATSDRLQTRARTVRRARARICSACSGGANAILLARRLDPLRPQPSACWRAAPMVSAGSRLRDSMRSAPSRPIDAARSIGGARVSGSAKARRSSSSRARPRYARADVVPLAELAGWSVGSEAHHITNPEEAGRHGRRAHGPRARARRRCALRDLDYVNAHGTGTPLNDAMESRALRQALGAELARVAVSSCKGQIGHTLGAAGAIEAAITVLAIARGEMPPTGGLEEPDDACDLVHVMGEGRRERGAGRHHELLRLWRDGHRSSVQAAGARRAGGAPPVAAPLGRRGDRRGHVRAARAARRQRFTALPRSRAVAERRTAAVRSEGAFRSSRARAGWIERRAF